jgi:hypothetical protein
MLIGSKLPTGLVLKHPLDPGIKVTIRGLNSAPVGVNKAPIIVPYMTTEVDKEFWDAWKMVHHSPANPFGPLASGALFEAKNEDHAKGIAKEQSARRTGLEPMPQETKDIKPAEKD